MAPPKSILLDGADEVEPHGAKLLNHGDRSVEAVSDQESAPLVLSATEDTRHITDGSSRTALGVRDFAIVSMVLHADVQLNSSIKSDECSFLLRYISSWSHLLQYPEVAQHVMTHLDPHLCGLSFMYVRVGLCRLRDGSIPSSSATR